MKDRQTESGSGSARIPLVSPALHVVAMTVVVFLRSSFGFAYLRPRSVFFALSWAFGLFLIYAWIEPGVWRKTRALCLFGSGALILYWAHLAVAFRREWSSRGKHDQDSGTSHLLRARRGVGWPVMARTERDIHLWVEPASALLVAGVLRFATGERRLSPWLFLAGGSLWVKEALNCWFRVRRQKRQEDVLSDAEDNLEPSPANDARPTELPNAARKIRVKRPRTGTPPSDGGAEE